MPKKAVLPKALHQQMAQSVSGTSPSLVPPKIMQKNQASADGVMDGFLESREIPSVDDLIADPGDRKVLHDLVKLYVANSGEKKRLEKLVKGASDRIKVFFAAYGITGRAVCEGATLNLFPTSRSTINTMKLLAAGVDQATIDLCTDVTKSYTLKIGNED